jgi:hypothetical protein
LNWCGDVVCVIADYDPVVGGVAVTGGGQEGAEPAVDSIAVDDPVNQSRLMSSFL